MRFALDGTFLYDAPTWGPAWRAVYDAMARAGGAELVVYLQSLRPRRRPPLDRRIATATIRRPRGALLAAWRAGRLPIERWTGPVDAVFVVSYRLPPAAAPRVVFLHDLVALTRPEALPPRTARDLAGTIPRVCREADLVVAASHATRREAIVRLGLSPEKVRVVYQGVDAARFSPGRPDPAALARYGLEAGYLLFVGTREPRKNLVNLALAYRALAGARATSLPPLVVAGAKGWLSEEDERVLSSTEGVRLLGFVPAADLPDIYRGAALFVWPSLEEGFGLPVLEAQAAGVPVVVSAVSSLPEVAGPGAYFVEPEDPASIARAIADALAEPPDRRAERVAANRAFAESFSWDRTARALLAVLSDAARRRTAGPGEIA